MSTPIIYPNTSSDEALARALAAEEEYNLYISSSSSPSHRPSRAGRRQRNTFASPSSSGPSSSISRSNSNSSPLQISVEPVFAHPEFISNSPSPAPSPSATAASRAADYRRPSPSPSSQSRNNVNRSNRRQDASSSLSSMITDEVAQARIEYVRRREERRRALSSSNNDSSSDSDSERNSRHRGNNNEGLSCQLKGLDPRGATIAILIVITAIYAGVMGVNMPRTFSTAIGMHPRETRLISLSEFWFQQLSVKQPSNYNDNLLLYPLDASASPPSPTLTDTFQLVNVNVRPSGNDPFLLRFLLNTGSSLAIDFLFDKSVHILFFPTSDTTEFNNRKSGTLPFRVTSSQWGRWTFRPSIDYDADYWIGFVAGDSNGASGRVNITASMTQYDTRSLVPLCILERRNETCVDPFTISTRSRYWVVSTPVLPSFPNLANIRTPDEYKMTVSASGRYGVTIPFAIGLWGFIVVFFGTFFFFCIRSIQRKARNGNAGAAAVAQQQSEEDEAPAAPRSQIDSSLVTFESWLHPPYILWPEFILKRFSRNRGINFRPQSIFLERAPPAAVAPLPAPSAPAWSEVDNSQEHSSDVLVVEEVERQPSQVPHRQRQRRRQRNNQQQPPHAPAFAPIEMAVATLQLESWAHMDVATFGGGETKRTPRITPPGFMP